MSRVTSDATRINYSVINAAVWLRTRSEVAKANRVTPEMRQRRDLSRQMNVARQSLAVGLNPHGDDGPKAHRPWLINRGCTLHGVLVPSLLRFHWPERCPPRAIKLHSALLNSVVRP